MPFEAIRRFAGHVAGVSRAGISGTFTKSVLGLAPQGARSARSRDHDRARPRHEWDFERPGGSRMTDTTTTAMTDTTARAAPIDHEPAPATTGSMMASRRFAPLFWTQALSALSDNFVKNMLVFLILAQAALAGGAEGGGAMVTIAGAIFMAPFLVLSALGGQLADRFSKGRMAERLKLAELGAAGVGALGIVTGSVPVLLVALGLFGTISALFGPVKYGILPEHLPARELPTANAWVEGATFVSILFGTIAAALAFSYLSPWVSAAALLAVSVGTWVASRRVPRTAPAMPGLAVNPNILASTWNVVSALRADTRLWRAGLMSAWFWGVGAVVLSLLPTFVAARFGGGPNATTAYLAVFAVSVAAGSAVAAWLCKGRTPLLPAPVGTGLVALFSLDLAVQLALAGPAAPVTNDVLTFFGRDGTWHVAFDLAGLAFSGALLVVPTFTAVQHWAPEERRARVVAAVNILGAALMVAAGALVAGAQAMGATIPAIFGALALANAVAAWAMFKYLPTSAIRDVVSILFRAFHRLEVEGLENMRAAGPAPILALNHVSFLDAPLALTLTEEEPIFAIDTNIAERWWVKPFLRNSKAIPLDPSKPLGTRTLIKAVGEGDPLVIFPEGRLTVTGSLMKVYDGAAMVADKTGSKIVPIRIDGLERSPFSRLRGKTRRQLFPKVKVTVLPPVDLSIAEGLRGRARRQAAGAELYRIMSELVFRTTPMDATILQRIIATARRDGFDRLAAQDPVTGDMSYGRLLTGARVLAGRFSAYPEQHVGVMLPNANGSIATVLGLMSAGKVPAMINFTAGPASILAACEAAEVKRILTSRAFVRQGKLDGVIEQIGRAVEIVWLDDLRETIRAHEKIAGRLLRARPLVRRGADDPAAVMFTSGSEGTPKGVVLTHRNILANVAQAAARIDFGGQDKVFNVLPIFHSFGLSAGTLLPLTSGVPVYFYPSPLHYRIVPELIYGSNATILFGTDTFLTGYARMANAYDFRSLRYVFAGAEPVRDVTRKVWAERFGLRILEGYGVTETAPVLAINTPMFNRPGSVGKLMPGVEARLEPVPGVDEGGRLHVRGPNVMAGYLRAEKPGVLEPPEGGWHDTGDIVTIDGEGFVTIRGRAKRFAKVGGEMVSLAAVESLAAELWPEHQSAVAAVKDERKGEKLVMVTDNPAASREQFIKFLKLKGAQDLMAPAELRTVDAVPLLGSGKVDFAGVQRLVEGEGEMAQAA